MPPKRKRSTTVTSVKKDAMDAVQPSSRDASDEGAEDPVLQAVASKKERQADANANGTTTTTTKRVRVKSAHGDQDSDEDERASKKSRRTSSLAGDDDHGEGLSLIHI